MLPYFSGFIAVTAWLFLVFVYFCDRNRFVYWRFTFKQDRDIAFSVFDFRSDIFVSNENLRLHQPILA